MNLNRFPMTKKRGRPKGGIAANQAMGPPQKPAPVRRKDSTPSTSTQWGKSQGSVLNSSMLHSTSTSTSFSENESKRTIIAITEGRGNARCEVGIACIDTSLPTLVLCQISDMHSYTNALTKINILNPSEIIVPATLLDGNNRLVDKVRKQFPNIKLTSAPRRTFNRTHGMERIMELCLPSINTICVGLQHKYYALASASALLTHLQHNLSIYYMTGSINVDYQESEGFAIIDVSTADRLELVSSTKPAQATRNSSLFGVLNHCFTKIGSRTLRSTILQPPCSVPYIEERLDCVTELVKQPEKLLAIQEILQKISNVDQLLNITTISSHHLPLVNSNRQLNYILLLNNLVDVIEPLKDALNRCQHPFLVAFQNTLNSDNFGIIKREIRTVIHPSAQPGKGEDGVTQRCFAIKAGINGLLDLVRKMYSERLEDLREYVRYLGTKYGLPLTLGNNNTKGYHIVLRLNGQQKKLMKKSDLPPEFIQVYRLPGSFTMKTPELVNYSTRLEDIMSEVLKISNMMINKIIVEIKKHTGFFYKLCEDISKLDMLQSLAEATLRNQYVRPKFNDFTELIEAKHPLLQFLCSDNFVMNPISICKDYNVQIITGPNGSGKSIYIRQAMLLQVMAQIGCYVPANSATFRPADRMFARIYLEDNMECGASAFVLEMKELKYMMTVMTENSLFIIDEVCRSTSVEEGAALAMAICEKLCKSSAFIYITTHFTVLTKLRDMYLNVKVWQMETEASGDEPRTLALQFTYSLVPGVTGLKQYGLALIRNVFPKEVMDEAYRILGQLENPIQAGESAAIDERVRAKYELESKLRRLKSLKKLTRSEINKHVNEYVNQIQRMQELELSPIKIILSNNHVTGGNQRREQIEQVEVFNGNVADEPPEFGFTGDFAPHFLCEDGAVSARPQQNFVPHQSFLNPENCQIDNFDTSSYRNLSMFLRESSDNINKLIPNISICCSESDSFGEVEPGQVFDSQQEVGETPESQVSIGTLRFQGCEEMEVESLMEELETCSQALLQDLESEAGTSQDGDIMSSVRTRFENSSESISYSPITSSSPLIVNTLTKLSTTLSKTSENCDTTKTNFDNASRNRCSDATSMEVLHSDEKTISKSDSSANQPPGVVSSEPRSDGVISPTPVGSTGRRAKTKRLNSKKFVPPRKLTKREIENEFREQDRKIYESDISEPNFQQNLTQWLKRPSVRQVQQTKHLASIRRTDNGVEVIAAPPELPKKRRGIPLKRIVSTGSVVDVSIFSDINAKPFEEFLNSNEKDVKKFNFKFGNNAGGETFNFRPGSGQTSGMFSRHSSFNATAFLTPDGFYKDNKENIERIVGKYLGSSSSENANLQGNCSRSIFESSFSELEL